MIRRRAIGPIVALIVASVSCAGVAADLPKEGSYDYVTCYAGVEHAQVALSKEYNATIREWLGTNQSVVPGGFLDKTSFRCVNLGANVEGKSSSSTYCVTIDQDGDKIFSRFVGDGTKAEGGTPSGTGKYDGIERTGASKNLGPFPLAKPGAFQTCVRNTGKYKLR